MLGEKREDKNVIHVCITGMEYKICWFTAHELMKVVN